MIRGPKPKPTAMRRMQGNPGKRGYNHAEPQPPEGMPDCPAHLNAAARDEWDRLAHVLNYMGVVTAIDRAALAAYCQCYGRWVEAEEKLKTNPTMLGDPVSLKAETSDTEPTADDRGALGTSKNSGKPKM